MADENVEKLRSEVGQLREDLSNVTESVKDLAASRGESAYTRLRETAGTARERAIEAERALESQVEARPLVSVLAAFAGGLITGLLLQLRR